VTGSPGTYLRICARVPRDLGNPVRVSILLQRGSLTMQKNVHTDLPLYNTSALQKYLTLQMK